MRQQKRSSTHTNWLSSCDAAHPLCCAYAALALAHALTLSECLAPEGLAPVDGRHHIIVLIETKLRKGGVRSSLTFLVEIVAEVEGLRERHDARDAVERRCSDLRRGVMPPWGSTARHTAQTAHASAQQRASAIASRVPRRLLAHAFSRRMRRRTESAYRGKCHPEGDNTDMRAGRQHTCASVQQRASANAAAARECERCSSASRRSLARARACADEPRACRRS